MSKGISVYIGMKYSLLENLEFIRSAHKLNYKNIFTSLHIPEVDYVRVIEEFKAIAALASSLGMNIIADISPRAFTYIGASISELKVIKEMGVYGVRVDFGFTAKEIAEFTRNPFDLIIEINASTVTKVFLEELEKNNVDFSKLQACHNYYPRLNTGISVATLKRKNEMLKKYNMKVSAFIPSNFNKRGPIFEGLPTLEIHRFSKPEVAAKHLYMLGLDDVIFGDSIPTLHELEIVASVDEKILRFNVNIFQCSPLEKSILFSESHRNRPDPAEDVIRSTGFRDTLKATDIILKHNNVERKIGYITIDNKDYLRYVGELQICKKNLSADNRVNVIGKIVDEELFLIDYVGEETEFKFIEFKGEKI